MNVELATTASAASDYWLLVDGVIAGDVYLQQQLAAAGEAEASADVAAMPDMPAATH